MKKSEVYDELCELNSGLDHIAAHIDITSPDRIRANLAIASDKLLQLTLRSLREGVET